MILAASMPGAPAISPARSWWAIFIFTVALMFNFLDRQLLTLLITPIKADLNLSDTQISLLVGFAFVVFYVGVGIPISRAGTRMRWTWLSIRHQARQRVSCALQASAISAT